MTVLDDREAARDSETAVLRRRLAECEAELEEARARETATAEVLQAISRSAVDLDAVLRTVVVSAIRLCHADHAVIYRNEGGEYRWVAGHSLPRDYEQIERNLRIKPGPGTLVGRTVIGRRTVQIADAWTDPLYEPKEDARVGGVHSMLGVPLLRNDEVLGVIGLARGRVEPYSEREVQLVTTFADQAVIAMENARLLTETREALEQQTATAEVLQVINASPGDLAPVFDAMLEKAMALCEAAFGVTATYDGKALRPVAMRGIPPRFAEFAANPGNQPGPGGATPRLAAGAQFVHVPDLREEEAYRSGDPFRRALVEIGEARSLLAVPLRKDGVMMGQIGIYRQEVRPFTDRQIALLQNFAAQAVIAMENARLLGELRARTDEIAAMNRELEARVAAQLGELERMARLKRFLAPQLAEMIVAQGEERILESHRRDIVVVFCDLRGFTTFSETAEPEEVLDLLRDYHAALGPLVTRFEGTLDHFSGDGIMVLFNDPLPCPDAPERAVAMALAMRESFARLQTRWRRHGRRIGFGVGIAQGYATVGQIGFAERVDYTAIGTVCNLAARLCAEAQDSQVLVSGRIAAAVEDKVRLEEIGDLALKGLSQAVAVYNIVGAER